MKEPLRDVCDTCGTLPCSIPGSAGAEPWRRLGETGASLRALAPFPELGQFPGSRGSGELRWAPRGAPGAGVLCRAWAWLCCHHGPGGARPSLVWPGVSSVWCQGREQALGCRGDQGFALLSRFGLGAVA